MQPGSPLDPIALRTLLLQQLDASIKPLDQGRRPTDARIHDTRRALKRARAQLSLLRPVLSAEDHRLCKRRLLDAGRALAGLRDARVLQQALRRMRRLAGLSPPTPSMHRPGPASGNASASPDGDRRVPCAAIAVRDINAARHCLASTTLLSTRSAPIAARLRKIYRRGRRQFRSLGPSSPAADWHQWRKQVKQYQYVLQAAEGRLSSPLDAAVRTAHALAGSLGEDHDLVLLQEHLATARAGKRTPYRLLQAIDQRRQQLQRRALKAGATLYADPPREIERRLRSALRSTRDRSGRVP